MVKQLGQSMAAELGEPRVPGEPLTQLHADVALWIQSETERLVLDVVRRLVAKTRIRNLCLAGGVALNCRLNSRLLASGEIAQLYIQPAAGDQGQCLGNALYGLSALRTGVQRQVFDHVFFGREYDVTADQIHRLVGDKHKVSRPSELCRIVAKYLLDGHIVGWFQGAAEFGPRALGHRSILASPLNPKVKTFLNEHVKRREPMMPYAASILEEYASEYFELSVPSPFMLLAPRLRPSKAGYVPALGHADGTVRLQTVSKSGLTLFRDLIMEFYKASGVPMLLNTSLNGAGEPIAESPIDALSCFERHDMDHLVIGPWLISKRQIGSDAKARLWVRQVEHAEIGQCA
jgi:carbamoyltransferase